MSIHLKGRHFLTLKGFTSHEIHYLLNLSQDLKKKMNRNSWESIEGEKYSALYTQGEKDDRHLIKDGEFFAHKEAIYRNEIKPHPLNLNRWLRSNSVYDLLLKPWIIHHLLQSSVELV